MTYISGSHPWKAFKPGNAFPNDEVLQGYPRFTRIAATAEGTSLADHSVDVVTAGQAFHLFDREQARREFLRILVPTG